MSPSGDQVSRSVHGPENNNHVGRFGFVRRQGGRILILPNGKVDHLADLAVPRRGDPAHAEDAPAPRTHPSQVISTSLGCRSTIGSRKSLTQLTRVLLH